VSELNIDGSGTGSYGRCHAWGKAFLSTRKPNLGLCYTAEKFGDRSRNPAHGSGLALHQSLSASFNDASKIGDTVRTRHPNSCKGLLPHAGDRVRVEHNVIDHSTQSDYLSKHLTNCSPEQAPPTSKLISYIRRNSLEGSARKVSQVCADQVLALKSGGESPNIGLLKAFE
jgi:hypothetical protein